MSLKILDIDRSYDGPDSEIIALVEEVVGEQIEVNEFAHVCECLSGEDYTIAERFWPALRHLYNIVKTQQNVDDQAEMICQLATTMRYAVWEMFSTHNFEPEVRAVIQDCCHLFLEASFALRDVDDKRYLLMGIAAGLGDAEAAKKLHDLGSGYG